jgi:regulator of CtrA degradation
MDSILLKAIDMSVTRGNPPGHFAAVPKPATEAEKEIGKVPGRSSIRKTKAANHLCPFRKSRACGMEPSERIAMAVVSGPALSDRLAETLYTEALLLADETHAYYDLAGRSDREQLEPRERVQFACEALKATTRLMHVIAWLATRRAIATGELPEGDPRSAERQLGESTPSDTNVLGAMPTPARRLILAGIDLHERVGRVAAGIEAPIATASPARALLQRLERSL